MVDKSADVFFSEIATLLIRQRLFLPCGPQRVNLSMHLSLPGLSELSEAAGSGHEEFGKKRPDGPGSCDYSGAGSYFLGAAGTMNDLLVFAGAAILVAMLLLAWRRWWGRLDDISAAGRVTLIATTVGGLIGAIFWWQSAEASFAWTLPPLASRMLGAAATAFGLAGLLALERPSPARARLHSTMTAIYLVPLTVAIATLHLDRFNFSAPITWSFFVIVALLVASSLAGAFAGGGPARPARVHGIEAVWLALAGTAIGAWGIALFAMPAVHLPLFFIWPADPLTSRLIASMLLTLAAAFLLSIADPDLTPQAHLIGAVYGFGVTVAISVNVVGGLPWPPAYLFALGAVGLVSLVFLLVRGAARKKGRARRPALPDSRR